MNSVRQNPAEGAVLESSEIGIAKPSGAATRRCFVGSLILGKDGRDDQEQIPKALGQINLNVHLHSYFRHVLSTGESLWPQALSPLSTCSAPLLGACESLPRIAPRNVVEGG